MVSTRADDDSTVSASIMVPGASEELASAAAVGARGSLSVRSATTRTRMLSNREREVLALVARGQLNKQIAYALSISEATVKAHVSAAMTKLDATNRTALALCFLVSLSPGQRDRFLEEIAFAFDADAPARCNGIDGDGADRDVGSTDRFSALFDPATARPRTVGGRTDPDGHPGAVFEAVVAP